MKEQQLDNRQPHPYSIIGPSRPEVDAHPKFIDHPQYAGTILPCIVIWCVLAAAGWQGRTTSLHFAKHSHKGPEGAEVWRVHVLQRQVIEAV